jgi:hypothetical protein
VKRDSCQSKSSHQFERARNKSDDTRDRLLFLLVIRNHAAADAECRRRRVERIGFTLAPMLEGVRLESEDSLLLRKGPQRIGGHVDVVRPNDVRSVIADAHLPEQFRRVAQRFIDADSLAQAGRVHKAFIASVPEDAQCQKEPRHQRAKT